MEYFNQKQPQKLCPECKTNKIHSGHLSVYNARLNSGEQVCSDCKLEEIYEGIGNKSR